MPPTGPKPDKLTQKMPPEQQAEVMRLAENGMPQKRAREAVVFRARGWVDLPPPGEGDATPNSRGEGSGA